MLAGLAEMRVPLDLVRWIARFFGGQTSILVGNAVVGDSFTPEAGIRQETCSHRCCLSLPPPRLDLEQF